MFINGSTIWLKRMLCPPTEKTRPPLTLTDFGYCDPSLLLTHIPFTLLYIAVDWLGRQGRPRHLPRGFDGASASTSGAWEQPSLGCRPLSEPWWPKPWLAPPATLMQSTARRRSPLRLPSISSLCRFIPGFYLKYFYWPLPGNGDLVRDSHLKLGLVGFFCKS